MTERLGLEQVRDRVLKATREVEQLARTSVSPEVFFPQFAGLLVSAMGARAGAVLLRDNDRQLRLACDVGLAQSGVLQNAALKAWSDEVASTTVASGEAGIHLAPSENGSPPGPVLFAAPLHAGPQCVGAVAVYHRGDFPQEGRVPALQFLEQMCGHASQFLAARQAGSPTAWATFRDDVEETMLRLHRSLDTAAVCSIAANDGRALLGADRVSVAVMRGGRARITAVSGQESVNRRSNLVRAMSALVRKVAAAREPLFFAGEVASLPPTLVEPMSRYLSENSTQIVALVPLLENPEPRAESDPQASAAAPRRVIGCLVVDGPGHPQLAARFPDAVRLLADHVAAALSNALTYRQIFLLPLWRFLGRRWQAVRARSAVLAAAVLVLLAAAGAALALVPWDYRVTAEGRLMPAVQRQIFAPWDGEVVEIRVRDGQRVQPGDVLLTLRSDDLRTHLLTSRNDLHEKQEAIFGLQAQIDDATKKADRDEETRLEGQLAATRAQVEGLTKQVALWEERQEQLLVRSPLEGVVATFRVDQLLQNRPVRRGEVLLEVMDDRGPWHLEIGIPENRMGHLRAAQRSLDPARPVEFLLATSPESTFQGTLGTVGTRTSPSEEHGSIVEAYVELDAEQSPARAIGAEVRAKIACGQRSLGYVLFGDFIEWVRKTFWL